MKKLFCVSILAFLTLFLVQPGSAQDWETVKQPDKIFQKGFIQVTGVSDGDQSRYSAMRAATVVAQRDLLEIIKGIKLHGHTTVKNGMLENDTIKSRVQGVLKGAVKCGKKYYSDQGYARVCMKVYLKGKNGMYNAVLPIVKDNPDVTPEKADFESTQETTEQKESQSQTGQSKAFDGLIIDVRDHEFKPALINRVVTQKDKVLFEPSQVVSDILVERGCGGFTNTPDKARALLSSWESDHPMLVKAQGVSKTTDARISSNKASRIYKSDSRTNFLSKAKVVFVLD